MLKRLGAVQNHRKNLLHINNPPPLLDEASPEHAQLLAAGIELAFDGMDIEL